MKDRLAEVSALLDSELESQALHRVTDSFRQHADLRQAWQVYGLIGDSLRGESTAWRDLTDAVMARVREEPVVLAPRSLTRKRGAEHPFFALAASVAGVTVVAWLAFSASPNEPTSFAAGPGSVPSAPTFAAVAATRPEPVQLVSQRLRSSANIRLSSAEACQCPEGGK